MTFPFLLKFGDEEDNEVGEEPWGEDSGTER
jgi:hypothetical protein